MPAAAALAMLTLAAPGCGSDDRQPAGVGGPATVNVSIAKFRFLPRAVVVVAGGTVRWTNGDVAPHTATLEGEGGFDTRTLEQGESRAITLEREGTFAYVCLFHPFMRGTVRVEA